MTELSPQVRAIVRDVAPLGALVARVLARGPQSVADLAVAVLVPDGQALPQVQTIGPWTEPVSVGGSMLRAAAVRAKVARELAAGRDRRAAAHLAREAPQGCAWALLFELDGVAVLCTRPSLGAPSNPTPPEAA